MPRAIVKLAYRQQIDVDSKGDFERRVFVDSYREFLLQAQTYNPEKKFGTLAELIASNPKANSLHYKVGFSVGLYIRDLKHVIPGLCDSMERQVIPFSTARFSIDESDLSDQAKHRVSILYETDSFTLFEIVGEYFLLTRGNLSVNESQQSVDTFLLKMQPNLSIISYEALPVSSPVLDASGSQPDVDHSILV